MKKSRKNGCFGYSDARVFYGLVYLFSGWLFYGSESEPFGA